MPLASSSSAPSVFASSMCTTTSGFCSLNPAMNPRGSDITTPAAIETVSMLERTPPVTSSS